MTGKAETTKKPSNRKLLAAILREAHQAEEDGLEFARKAQNLRRKAAMMEK